MKISVIVPVYNVEAYLRECLDSLVNQTIDDYEIIAVDDGSTDGSPAILAEYADRFPKLIRIITVENGGQGRARNFGIDEAQGEYLAFIDSDDYISSVMLERMYCLAKEKDSNIVACDFIQVNSDASKLVLPATLKEDIILSFAGSASNKIFRRSAVGKIRFPEHLKYEDFEFSAKMIALSAGIEYLREPLYFYRCGQISTMHNQNSEMNLDILSVMDHLKQFFEETCQKESYEYLLINHVLLDAVKRVEAQNGTNKKIVLEKLVLYVKENIKNLNGCKSFRRESVGRKAVMWMNYNGLASLAVFLLKLKQ